MQFTKESILKIAMTQSAVDAGCKPEDFLRQENVIVRSEASPAARKYLELPFACNLISYGSNIVASVSDDCREAVEAYLLRTPIAHCFETPGIHLLDAALAGKGLQTCFMAEYFLPDPEKLRPLSWSVYAPRPYKAGLRRAVPEGVEQRPVRKTEGAGYARCGRL